MREYVCDVNAISERELQEAYAGVREDLAKPRALLRRLELVARLLREVPEAARVAPLAVWLDAAGKVGWLPMGEAPLTVGRDAGCAVVLANARVSRRHCRLSRSPGLPGTIEVADLGSSNGTLVNGEELPAGVRRALADGDVIEVGGIPLVVIQDAAG